ncbi:MAG: GNAT family N-acetyltransferase [Bacteroidota bacterium]|nr:GNAT family N-acetyltransferase [Bacteroidota bacterium]
MNIDLNLLYGRYVHLQFLKEEHIPVLRILAKDERIWEFTKTLLIDDTYDEQFDRYITSALSNQSDGSYSCGLQQTFTVFRKEDNAIIGMTRYYGIDEKQKRLDIGYTWYIPEVWSKVYNKECKLLLLQYAFEILSFNRVEFHVAHQNIRSQRAVEKIGGVKEGVLRKHGYRADGSLRDTVIYSIINDEWPRKKEHLLGLIAAAEKAAAV